MQSMKIRELAYAVAAIKAGTVETGGRDYYVTMLRYACTAAKNAYCPYSKFHVGAAILTSKNNIYAGCNVENVMYNGMSHAELTAISNAILNEGSDMKIKAMTIWTPTKVPCPSCGGCRQLIREHSEDMLTIITSYCEDPTVKPLWMRVGELLPESFGPEMLT